MKLELEIDWRSASQKEILQGFSIQLISPQETLYDEFAVQKSSAAFFSYSKYQQIFSLIELFFWVKPS